MKKKKRDGSVKIFLNRSFSEDGKKIHFETLPGIAIWCNRW